MVWRGEEEFCPGQKVADMKSNEITAIPELLDRIRITGRIVAIAIMETQTASAKKIRSKCGDYGPMKEVMQKWKL